MLNKEMLFVYLNRLLTYSLKGEGVMALNTIFNNISIISWRSVVLVEVTGVPGEIHRPVGRH